MFGRRPDGKLLKKVDPVIALTSYLMPMRCDAQVFSSFKADYEKMARYIVEQRGKGYKTLSLCQLPLRLSPLRVVLRVRLQRNTSRRVRNSPRVSTGILNIWGLGFCPAPFFLKKNGSFKGWWY